jgi:signal transduction histidine kinase
MSRSGLRLRITLAFAAVCLAVVAALGITLYTAADDLEEALIDQIVSEEASSFIQEHRRNPSYRPGHRHNFEYHLLRAGEDTSRARAEVAALAPGNHEILIDGQERHVAVREADAARYIVIYDVGAHETREQQFKTILLLSLGTVALVALVLGYWLAGALTQQLTDLAKRVTELAPEGLHSPLLRSDQDAEVAALARALDDYQSRITRMIRREHEFTANASHELRTPLTAINTSCELLLADADLPERTRVRVQMIDEAARRMAEQLTTLLFLAREERLDDIEDVALAECVADATEPFREEIARKGVSLQLDIAPAAVVTVNRQALHTVVANLMRNAVQHTDRGTIRVSYLAKRLNVTDSGTGIAADHLPRIFERYYRATQDGNGSGLGLAIVKRICDHYGWRVEASSALGRGSDFAIVFP